MVKLREPPSKFGSGKVLGPDPGDGVWFLLDGSQRLGLGDEAIFEDIDSIYINETSREALDDSGSLEVD
jgi:hypothetical protein